MAKLEGNTVGPSLRKGSIGECLPGGHLPSWLSFETNVSLETGNRYQTEDGEDKGEKESTRSHFLEEEAPVMYKSKAFVIQVSRVPT